MPAFNARLHVAKTLARPITLLKRSKRPVSWQILKTASEAGLGTGPEYLTSPAVLASELLDLLYGYANRSIAFLLLVWGIGRAGRFLFGF